VLQELTRPFTEAERRLLRRRSQLPKPGEAYWTQREPRKAVVSVLVCAAIIGLGVAFDFPVVAFIMAGLFAAVRIGGYFERRKVRRHMMTFYRKLADELEAGDARVISCRPVRIFERKEFEDEGAFWIFDGGNGRYLALCGQEHHETPRFPSDHFELILGARHRVFLGVRAKGKRMPSTMVVEGDEISWDTFPEEAVTLFDAPRDGDLPAILRSLDGVRQA
jgi:hypothetical protein